MRGSSARHRQAGWGKRVEGIGYVIDVRRQACKSAWVRVVGLGRVCVRCVALIDQSGGERSEAKQIVVDSMYAQCLIDGPVLNCQSRGVLDVLDRTDG